MEKENLPKSLASDPSSDGYLDKDLVRQKILAQTKTMKIRNFETSEDGKLMTQSYDFDNEHLEHKSKKQIRLEKLEKKYEGKGKIIFHQLDDEGNMKLL